MPKNQKVYFWRKSNKTLLLLRAKVAKNALSYGSAPIIMGTADCADLYPKKARAPTLQGGRGS